MSTIQKSIHRLLVAGYSFLPGKKGQQGTKWYLLIMHENNVAYAAIIMMKIVIHIIQKQTVGKLVEPHRIYNPKLRNTFHFLHYTSFLTFHFQSTFSVKSFPT